MANEIAATLDAYNREADSLSARYESRSFEEIHSDALDLLPDSTTPVLDIGAGSGRDAAWIEPALLNEWTRLMQSYESDTRRTNDL